MSTSGAMPCSNLADNRDYESSLEGGELVFPEEIPKDAPHCIPDELTSVGRFLEEVFWSNSEIAVHIEGDSITWEVGERRPCISRSAECAPRTRWPADPRMASLLQPQQYWSVARLAGVDRDTEADKSSRLHPCVDRISREEGADGSIPREHRRGTTAA